VLSGLFGRELEFLGALLDDLEWRAEAEGRELVLRHLARAIVREGSGERVGGLLEWIERKRALPETAWQLEALVSGALDGRPTAPDGGPDWIRLPRELEQLAELAGDPRTAPLAAALAWPGRAGTEVAALRPLTEPERARFERGAAIYAEVCAACHFPSGRGGPALAPPLRGSTWVLGPKERLLRILLHGLAGPLEVQGTRWELEMPAFSTSDADLAAVATYVRREWGHGAEPVTPEAVRAVRAANAGRARPWTAAELEAGD